MQRLQSSALIEVAVAEPPDIDLSVVLGHISGRELGDVTLRIGAGARLRVGTMISAGTMIGAGFEAGHHVVIREENVIW